MNCFEHSLKPAVAVCSFCGRGLCHDCATVVSGKSSCRGDCQQQIARELKLMQLSDQAMNDRSVVFETSGSIYQKSFVTMTTFGVLLTFVGALALLTDFWLGGVFLLALGVVFSIAARSHSNASKKFKKLASDIQS